LVERRLSNVKRTVDDAYAETPEVNVSSRSELSLMLQQGKFQHSAKSEHPASSLVSVTFFASD
jgi:hypothetical protein